MARTWVVAADAARARIFESEKRSGASMQERETWVNPELRLPAQELVTDEPGRGGGAAGAFAAGGDAAPMARCGRRGKRGKGRA